MPQSTSATPTREIWLRVMQVQRFVSLNYSSVSHRQDRPETLSLMTKDTASPWFDATWSVDLMRTTPRLATGEKARAPPLLP